MGSVRLRLQDNDFLDWTEVRVTRSLQQLAGEFDLVASGNWTLGGRRPRLSGLAAEVLLDDRLVLSGYVDACPAEYDANTYTVRIEGRDRTGDLVDSSAHVVQWKGRTLAEVARELCKPFGIKVIDNAKSTTRFTSYKPSLGDTVFESLEHAAKLCAVLLTASNRGELVIDRAGSTRAAGKLALGENILSARGMGDLRECFSEYMVRGQRHGAQDISKCCRVQAVSYDERFRALKRHRPRYVVSEGPIGPGAAQVRADWERNLRLARSQAVTYTVEGWQQDDGELWVPNQIIPVLDEFQGVDGDRLITDVAYLDHHEDGRRCELTVMPADAFKRIPDPEEEPI
jgi:prophage tail gpP-like protein